MSVIHTIRFTKPVYRANERGIKFTNVTTGEISTSITSDTPNGYQVIEYDVTWVTDPIAGDEVLFEYSGEGTYIDADGNSAEAITGTLVNCDSIAAPPDQIAAFDPPDGDEAFAYYYDTSLLFNQTVNPPTSYSKNGTWPTGVDIDADTGILSGVPDATGSPFTGLSVTATNAYGSTTTEDASISVVANIGAPVFSGTVSAPAGSVGAGYYLNISQYFTGNDIVYTVSSGTLPDGLTINDSTGVISGIPTTEAVTSGLVVTGTNVGGNASTGSFSITIGAAVSGMGIGMNLNWNADYDTPLQFINLVRTVATRWSGGNANANPEKLYLTTVTGNSTLIVVPTQNDEETWEYTLKNTTYDVKWTGTADLKVIDFDGNILMDWNSTNAGTFTPQDRSRGLKVLATDGTVTDIAVTENTHTATYEGGQEWHPDYITFLSGLNLKVLRFMDLNNTNGDLRELWSERCDETYLSWFALRDGQLNKDMGTVPYEQQIALANLLGVDPYFHVPHRYDWTQTEVSGENWAIELAQLVEANLDGSLKPYYELGNEVWNSAFQNTGWFTNMQRALNRYEADYSHTTKLFTDVAHGLIDNQDINILTHKDNAVKNSTGDASWGVKDVGADTADTFYVEDATDTTLQLGVGATKAYYILPADATTEYSMSENYCKAIKEMWDDLTTGHGHSDYYTVVGSKAENPSVTSERLTSIYAEATAYPDYIAIAPYSNGEALEVAVDIDDSVATPKIWISRSQRGKNSFNIYAGIYADGSTPTATEVKTGAGTGFVAGGDSITLSTATDQDWQSFTQRAVVNDTAYDIWFMLDGPFGEQLVGPLDFTASATASTVVELDSEANQKARDLYDAQIMRDKIAEHAAILPNGVELINYECGHHYTVENSGATRTAEGGQNTSLANWFKDTYIPSQSHADVIEQQMTLAAQSGIKQWIYYKDVSVTMWYLVRYLTETNPTRTMMESYAGTVSIYEQPELSNVAVSIETDPGTFPYTVTDINDANTGNDTVGTALTYTIESGNDAGLFAINSSTGVITMIADTGVNWTSSSAYTLTIKGDNGNLSDTCEVAITLGSIWYPVDAMFVFDSVDDNDATEATAVIGTDLPNTGVAMTISSDMWDASGGGHYYLNGAVAADTDATVPWLVAHVLEDANANGETYFQWGTNATGIQLETPFGSNYQVNVDGGLYTGIHAKIADGTKFVFWAYYDGTNVHTGVNQTSHDHGVRDLTGITLQDEVALGGDANSNDSAALHGDAIILSRAGLTLTEAKGIIQKMQDRWSIT